MRWDRACALSLAAVCTLAAAAAVGQEDDARRVLAAARQAMGGDTALAAVRTFAVSGRARRNLGRFVADQSVEISCELPDRFVRVASYDAAFGAPMGLSMQVTQRDGFNGTDEIRETIQQGDRLPAPPPPVQPPRTPEEKAARARAALAHQQQPFARLMLALFAASFDSVPLQFTSAGRVSLADGTSAEAVDATGPNDFTARVIFDATSHLPVAIVWREKPMIITSVTTSTAGTIVTSPNGMPPLRTPPPPVVPPDPPAARSGAGMQLPPGAVYMDHVPSGDPTAGLPMVEHVLSLGDYRIADGLNWPHRLVERVNAQVLDETTLGKFKVNVNIAPSKFKTAAR